MRPVRARRLAPIALLVGALLSARALGAQSPGAARAVVLVAENDLFSVRGHGAPADYDYTHGTHLGVVSAAVPDALARLLRAGASCRTAGARASACATSELRLAQDIYTPRRDGELPVRGERPYAGWLALAAGVQRVAPGIVRDMELEVGVTGRPSLAEEAQMDVHRIVDSAPQRGWRHQLASRGAVALRYGELRRVENAAAASKLLVARAGWSVVAGNALTALSAGGDVTIGVRGGAPWSPAAPDESQPAALFFRLGAREDVVLRSAFIEGWRRGSAATLRRFVPEGEATVGARWHRLALEYRQVMRGAEYRAEPSPHPYGSFRLVIDGY